MAVRTEVVSMILEVLPGVSAAQVTDDLSLSDLGADSVDRVEIILSIKERLNCDRPLSEFAEIPNIGALVTFLSAVDAS
ncbi:phosphopantetheine-binding protein [Streptomyces sp. NPDC020965]|uniref:phosphopantetheine-binding protein n=1 Tax=Streptomyces sp. NPDC020965 TaxID=3365105 RepID=UPI0037B8FCE6